jgi:hypothetical protein
MTESDIENELGRVMLVFKYIDDKDVFQKFYSRLLAKRLTQGLSISLECEAGMISRIKVRSFEHIHFRHLVDTNIQANYSECLQICLLVKA